MTTFITGYVYRHEFYKKTEAFAAVANRIPGWSPQLAGNIENEFDAFIES